MQEWVEKELKTSELGDSRLDARFRTVTNDLSQKPSVSIPAACNGWNDTLAAYRFFGNKRVTAENILAPHQKATTERIQKQETVLLVQDTTEIDVTRRHVIMSGSGPLNEANRFGFYNHAILAVTPDKIPLGVIGTDIYSRDLNEFLENLKDKKERAKKSGCKPIEEKESFRWLEGYRLACEVQNQCPGTRIICISDSEGDIYECLTEGSVKIENKADWIIRACQDRCLAGQAEGLCISPKLWKAVSKAEILGNLEIEVKKNEPKSKDKRKRKQKKTARDATVTVQAKRVEMKAPYRKGLKLENVEVNAVSVREINGPEDEPPVEWLLLTSLSISSFEDVCLVIEYYGCRWQIEIYFRVLKSGCKIEDRQFESAENYMPCLAIFMIVAWRVMSVMMMSRKYPEMPCDTVFSEDEWKAVYVIVKKQKYPPEAPKLEESVKMVAHLGGYLGRKKDGPPGPKTLWIGMQRMMDYANAWRILKSVGMPPDGTQICV